MKANVVLQFQGREKSEEEMIKEAQQAWKDAGRKVADIKSLRLYAKPEEAMVYYVINDDFEGSFGI